MPAPVERHPTLLSLSVPEAVYNKIRREQARRVLSGRKKSSLAVIAAELLTVSTDNLPD